MRSDVEMPEFDGHKNDFKGIVVAPLLDGTSFRIPTRCVLILGNLRIYVSHRPEESQSCLVWLHSKDLRGEAILLDTRPASSYNSSPVGPDVRCDFEGPGNDPYYTMELPPAGLDKSHPDVDVFGSRQNWVDFQDLISGEQRRGERTLSQQRSDEEEQRSSDQLEDLKSPEYDDYRRRKINSIFKDPNLQKLLKRFPGKMVIEEIKE